jgi:hypothetical protein
MLPSIAYPLRAARLLTRAKSFREEAVLGHPQLNAWGLHVKRVQLAYAVNQRRRARLGEALSREDREAFARDGFVIRPNFLSASRFEALRAQVEGLRTDVRERFEGSTLLRKVPIDAKLLAAAPALRDLVEDRTLRALMAYGEGNRAKPAFYLQTVLQNQRPGVPDPQCSLHRDTFHPTTKAWLYLTDVPLEAGPLVYVPGSHRLTPARLAWERRMSLEASARHAGGSFRVAAQDLVDMGYPPPRPLAVAANTLVVADTFGFHARGTSAGLSTRLEVWAIGQRTPFLDVWTERAIGWLTGRRTAVGWWQTRAGTNVVEAREDALEQTMARD